MNHPNCSIFQDTLKSVYEYVNRSLSFVEAKNGSLVVYNTALLLGAIQFIQNKSSSEHLLPSILFILSTLPLVISLLVTLWSFRPKQRSKESKKDNHVAKLDSEQSRQILLESIYSTEGLSNIGIEGFTQFLQNQAPNYTLTDADNAIISCTLHTARVSARKYKLFRYALCLGCIGTGACFISFILFIFS